MRQEDGGKLVKVFGLVLFEPKDLRSRVAGQHRVADGADRPLGAAEFRGDFLALGGSRSVAPEFGRSNHFARLIERNETVLLTAHPDGPDLGGAGLGLPQRLPHGAGRRLAPGVRMLLLGPWRQTGDQIVCLRRGGEDFAIARVHDQGLGRLRAAVDADEECSHFNSGQPPGSAGRMKNARRAVQHFASERRLKLFPAAKAKTAAPQLPHELKQAFCTKLGHSSRVSGQSRLL